MLLESALLFMSAALSVPAPPAQPTPPGASRGGYWISVELYGPEAARTAAARSLSMGVDPRAPRDRLPPGESVGYMAEIQPALAWVASHVFATEHTPPTLPVNALQLRPARIGGGRLRERFAVHLAAFVVTGATPEGDTRKVDWPVDGASILPIGSTWQGASLIPARAPLFAAPTWQTPPAGEGFSSARRSGEIYVVDVIDRCRQPPGARSCLRWAQVVARDGDRFVPGYLPRYQVAVRSAWVRGQGALPRAQLIPIGTEGDQALFVLLARARDNVLHRATLRAPTSGGFPPAALTVEGDWGTVAFGNAPPQRYPLDATLDARVR